jgi:fibronectin type 3 domain-containing protein
MWKKVMSTTPLKAMLTICVAIALVSLFGCTTGTKSAGLVDYEAPSVPKNVTGIGKEKACQISWSANTEADLVGYKVYRSTNSGGPFSYVATIAALPAPEYYDDDRGNKLVNDQYYYYKVSAFDTQGKESDLSLTNSIQIKAGLAHEEKPPRVVNLKARASTEAVYVSWDKVTTSNIKGYNIYRGLSSTAGGVSWITSVPVSTPGFVDTSISKSSAENYTYIIRAFTETYTESENSDPIQVTLKSGDDTIPCAPFNLSLSTEADPVVSWSKPLFNEDGSAIFNKENATMDLDSYLIFRANSNDALFSLIGIVEDNGTANLTQTFKDVNGSSYNLFAVRALDSNGNVSKLSSVTTLSSNSDIPATPQNLRAWSSSATESGIRLAWDSSQNATSYNIYFSTTGSGAFAKAWTGQSHWTESSSNVINIYPSAYNQNPDKKGLKLEFGVPYYFKVSAVSSSGKESELSNTAFAYPGGQYVAILEGENPNWEYAPANSDYNNTPHVYIAYNSTSYPNIDNYSGAGSALLVPTSVGINGDKYRYGAGTLFSSDYFRLPAPTTSNTFYKYNVYAYYFPHTTSGQWRCEIRENGILASALLQKDISAYSPVNKGRTVINLGQVSIGRNVAGVDIDMTAMSAGAGGQATLFLDALVFVRSN